jgi:activator of the mannose operon (transcriptional antiterminator)
MERIIKITDLIINSKLPLTVDTIANILKISNKTVRNDLYKIEDFVKSARLVLCKKPGVGITIEGTEECKINLINSLKDSTSYIEPYSPEDRKNHILKTLFLNKSSITIKELADSLYVSRVTIQKHLEEVENWLDNFHLKLLRKTNYGIEVTGDEENWRNAIASLIAQSKGNEELRSLLCEDYEGRIDYRSILKLKELINLDYKSLEKIVTAAENKLKFKFSDEAFISLVMHIAISIKRLNAGKDIKLSEEILISLRNMEEYSVAYDMSKEIGDVFKVIMPEPEIGYILLHILGTKMFENKNKGIELNIENVKGTELASIMANEIIEIAQRVLSINFKNDNVLRNGLILHLRPTINRLKYGLTLRNPILKEIKENYPEIYGAAWMTSVVFEKYLGVKIQEEELGYICLHLGASVERNKNPLKTIVVCASGIGTSQLIAIRLEKSFKQLEIVDVISTLELKQLNYDEIDIIISTIPIEVKKPLLIISPLLKQNDIKKIEYFINNTIEAMNNKEIVEEELVHINVDSTDKENAIKEICSELFKKGYITQEYLPSTLRRESIASTAIGKGIAIPHGDTPYVNKSCIAARTYKNSIAWGEEAVDVVIMICLSEKDIQKSKSIFRSLYNLLDSDEFIDKIRTSKDKGEIARILEGWIHADQ